MQTKTKTSYARSGFTAPDGTNPKHDPAALEPIAIIGIGCRLPGGVDSPDAYLDLLRNGVDAISEVPADRYTIDSFYDPDPTKPQRTFTRFGGFIEQRIDEMDAEFFGMSPREAASLDPMQRWLLEVTWEALEDGGQVPERLRGSNVGVFIGAFTFDYNVMQYSESNRHLIEANTGTGGAMTMLSARISYLMDFRGPSFALDTACSSSMVAVHQACQSLWNQESSIALAGGVNAMFMPEYTITNGKAGMLSPDGRCKTFDARANGYVRGEGAAIVVLKPLSKALADCDPVYAVIRGTACNQDGRSNGITVPNGEAQTAVMAEACRRAGVNPGEIQYVEAHGTGTPVGDPIEVKALSAVLSRGRPADRKCYIGSVKTNIGHTEAVAGVAGLIKVALCLKHGEIPASLHFETPNPDIGFDELCVEVCRQTMDWPAVEGPRLAGVNSFGFGGTNAHVIMEQAPVTARSSESTRERPHLLAISAKSEAAVRQLSAKYADRLRAADEEDLSDICATAAMRRTHHPHRAGFVGHGSDDMIAAMDAIAAADTHSNAFLKRADASAPARPVFVFSGMGPQWWAMGHQLLESNGVFRCAVERCDKVFTKLAGWSILDVMKLEEHATLMGDTEVAQPANFCLQVGLAEVFESMGIMPSATVGHSAGEVAAAYLSGALSLEQAVKTIYHRSRVQQKATGLGMMVAVGLPASEAAELIAPYDGIASIAAINSPNAVTLSGDSDALGTIVEVLQARQVFCRFLNVAVPYHSHFMEPLKEDLFSSLAQIETRETTIPLYSSVTGTMVTDQPLDAAYWWKNVREPVFFRDAMEQMITDGYGLFLEISPHPVLSSSVSDIAANMDKEVAVVSTLRRYKDESLDLMSSLCALYVNGAEIDWGRLYGSGFSCVSLPRYPWQRQTYWKESEESANYRLGSDIHPLLGRRLPSPDPAWVQDLDADRLAYLGDHRIQGTVVFPGAGYVEMGWAASREVYGDGATAMQIDFHKALYLQDGQIPKLRLTLDRERATFRIHSRLEGAKEWTLHAGGRLIQQQRQTPKEKQIDRSDIAGRCRNAVDPSVCYDYFRNIGLQYGPTFQGIERLWQGEHETLARIRIHPAIDEQSHQYKIHPAVLDVCFQVLAAALPFPNTSAGEAAKVYMPTGVEQGWVYGRPQTGMWIHSRVTYHGVGILKGDITLFDEKGNRLVEIVGCRAVILEDPGQARLKSQSQDFYEVEWTERAESEGEGKGHSNAVWVLLREPQGRVADELAKSLRAFGPVVEIFPGDEYAEDSEGAGYTLDPARAEDYRWLLTRVASRFPEQGIELLHLWGWGASCGADLNQQALKAAEVAGPLSLMHLLHAVSESEASSRLKVRVITRAAQVVPGDDPEVISLAQGSLWGLGRVAGHQEYKDHWRGMIDIDAHVLVEHLSRAVVSFDDDEEVALRGGKRYVSRLRECKRLLPTVPASFQSDASYLITGGLGSLGLLIARWMVRQGARHLILMGRTPLPPRSEWMRVPEGERVADLIKAVRELEADGVTCHLAAVDVQDEGELGRYLVAYEAEGWPTIRGVIHAAGVARPQLIAQLDDQQFRAVMRPKTLGAWNLHQMTRRLPIDFFVLFSSVASVVVSPGQGNYAAGNAFLDLLAQYRRSAGLPALSINWGPWGDIGMATNLDLEEYFHRRGMFPITSDRGLEAFERVFGQDLPQVLIMSADWNMVREMNYPMGFSPALVSEVGSSSETNETTAEAATRSFTGEEIRELMETMDEEGLQGLLADHILHILARVLRLSASQRDKLEVSRPMNTLGLDSMMAVELKRFIDKSLGVGVAVVDLLNGSSPASLAVKVWEQIKSEERCPCARSPDDLIRRHVPLGREVRVSEPRTARS